MSRIDNITITLIAVVLSILAYATVTLAQEPEFTIVFPADTVELETKAVSLDDPNQSILEDFCTEAVVMYRDMALAAMDAGLEDLAQYYMNKALKEEAEQK